MNREQIEFQIEALRSEMEQIDLYYSNTGTGEWPESIIKRYMELENEEKNLAKLLKGGE